VDAVAFSQAGRDFDETMGASARRRDGASMSGGEEGRPCGVTARRRFSLPHSTLASTRDNAQLHNPMSNLDVLLEEFEV
jgi:hypothetical protein